MTLIAPIYLTGLELDWEARPLLSMLDAWLGEMSRVRSLPPAVVCTDSRVVADLAASLGLEIRPGPGPGPGSLHDQLTALLTEHQDLAASARFVAGVGFEHPGLTADEVEAALALHGRDRTSPVVSVRPCRDNPAQLRIHYDLAGAGLLRVPDGPVDDANPASDSEPTLVLGRNDGLTLRCPNLDQAMVRLAPVVDGRPHAEASILVTPRYGQAFLPPLEPSVTGFIYVAERIRQGGGYGFERWFDPDGPWRPQEQTIADGSRIQGRQSLPLVLEMDHALCVADPNQMARLDRIVALGHARRAPRDPNPSRPMRTRLDLLRHLARSVHADDEEDRP